jgi:hypothetical protein
MATGLQSRLEAAIALLLEAHPCPLRVLMGQFPPPGPDEVSLLASERPKAARKLADQPGEHARPLAEIFSSAIDEAGGWPRVVEAARAWARGNPREWQIVVEHTVWVKKGRIRVDGSQAQRIANKYDVSRNALCRIAKAFPGELAGAVAKGRKKS